MGTRILAVLFFYGSTHEVLVAASCKDGYPADYSLRGCFADSTIDRIMPKIRLVHLQEMTQQGPMSAETCYYICDDGLNTHFGMEYSTECWCAVEPDMTKHGPELDPIECDHLCFGTTTGEYCGGFNKMSVYEITAYQGCQRKDFEMPVEQVPAWVPGSEDKQVIGQPWDFQEKFDTVNFFSSDRGDSSSFSNHVRNGSSCDVEDDHKKLLDQTHVWQGARKTTPRVFCGIYTHQNNHATKAIKETWASHCDGFVAFSDAADLDLQTFQIKHEGPEEYANMWQKSRAIWKYINFHYKGDFDWFVLGGDDLFIIVENLRKYLLSEEVKRAAGGLENGGTTPVYLGRRLRGFGDDNRIYNNGGASYVLNQASVGLLADHLDDDDCQPHTKKPWEDVLIGSCLKKNGVEPLDTRDNLGRERFHPFTPGAHFGYRKPAKLENRRVSGCKVGAWYLIQAIDLKFGRECCSDDSISFHYVDEQLMRRLHDLLYLCPKDAVDEVAVV
ncbi:unnamed protein product [Ectocarpus sp. 12 AP-2014]